MNQVRLIKPGGERKTYVGCVGVKAVQGVDGTVTLSFKQIGAIVPWVELRLPYDGDVAFVMDGRGKTIDTYRAGKVA